MRATQHLPLQHPQPAVVINHGGARNCQPPVARITIAPQASAVVFLSPMLTVTQFTQAAGRVVRQGSLHASVRVIVLGAANTIETEDSEKVERFRRIAERSAPSAGSSGA